MVANYSVYLGQQNETGDDSLIVIESNGSIYFCVADGAAGAGNGLNASQAVVNALKELAEINEFDQLDDFENFLRKLDIEIFENNNCGETTEIVGKVSNSFVVGGSIGDSEAWLFNSDFDYEFTSHQYKKPLLGSRNSTAIGFGSMEVSIS